MKHVATQYFASLHVIDDREEDAMRVELHIDGGMAYFPGLSKPVVVDSRELSDAQATQLQQLIDSARFFELPAASRALPKGAADMRHYTITVVDGRRRRTVRLNDPVEDPHLQALIAFLQGQRSP
jgi:hypothetical protein